jgi:hypothetical protein
MPDVLAARDGLLLLLDASSAGNGLGRGGSRESWSLQIVNLGPGHAFVGSCRVGVRGVRPIELRLPQALLEPGSTTPIFARALLASGGSEATLGRPQPNPVEIGRPLLLEADLHVGDKQLRATCVITVSNLSGDALVFEATSPALVPSR